MGGGASPPVGHAGRESEAEEGGESDDEFQFHHWTSRLSPPPPRGATSPSLPGVEMRAGELATDDRAAGASPPPPLPLFSYPFPPSSPPPHSDFSDPALSPRPLVIAPHTARANAKAQAARDKRVSINGPPGGMGLGRERRVSVSRSGEGGKRMSIARGGGGGAGGEGREKRDSIVVMRERRVPPKPLGSRGFIGLGGEGGAGSAPAGGAYGGVQGGYAGYGTYGGVAGGVSTGRVVKAIDRMVVRERGISFGAERGSDRGSDRGPFDNRSFGERSPPPLKSPSTTTGERPVTREGGGRPKSRKGGAGVGGLAVGVEVAGAGVGPPLAPPPTRGLPPVPVPPGGGSGGRARGGSGAGR